MTIWDILKAWKPEVKWIGNDITYDYSGGGITVSCEQIGNEHYMATIDGMEGRKPSHGHGKSCVLAVFAAVSCERFWAGVAHASA